MKYVALFLFCTLSYLVPASSEAVLEIVQDADTKEYRESSESDEFPFRNIQFLVGKLIGDLTAKRDIVWKQLEALEIEIKQKASRIGEPEGQPESSYEKTETRFFSYLQASRRAGLAGTIKRLNAELKFLNSVPKELNKLLGFQDTLSGLISFSFQKDSSGDLAEDEHLKLNQSRRGQLRHHNNPNEPFVFTWRDPHPRFGFYINYKKEPSDYTGQELTLLQTEGLNPVSFNREITKLNTFFQYLQNSLTPSIRYSEARIEEGEASLLKKMLPELRPSLKNSIEESYLEKNRLFQDHCHSYYKDLSDLRWNITRIIEQVLKQQDEASKVRSPSSQRLEKFIREEKQKEETE